MEVSADAGEEEEEEGAEDMIYIFNILRPRGGKRKIYILMPRNFSTICSCSATCFFFSPGLREVFELRRPPRAVAAAAAAASWVGGGGGGGCGR